MLLYTGIVTAQNNQPFYGVWEATTVEGHTFKVSFFEDEDGDIGGHYILYEVNSLGVEVIIYKSNRILGNGSEYPSVIAGVSDSNELGALIEDNINWHKYGYLDGNLKVKFLSGSGDVGSTASWRVRRPKSGIRFTDDDREFTIPTDLTLTKVSN